MRPGQFKQQQLLIDRSIASKFTRQEKIVDVWLTEAGEIYAAQVPVWGKYIMDFYLPARNLVLEVDGRHHYSIKRADYDDERSREMKMAGLRVLRIPNAIVNEGGRPEVLRLIEAFEPGCGLPLASKWKWRWWAEKFVRHDEARTSKLLKMLCKAPDWREIASSREKMAAFADSITLPARSLS